MHSGKQILVCDGTYHINNLYTEKSYAEISMESYNGCVLLNLNLSFICQTYFLLSFPGIDYTK